MQRELKIRGLQALAIIGLCSLGFMSIGRDSEGPVLGVKNKKVIIAGQDWSGSTVIEHVMKATLEKYLDVEVEIVPQKDTNIWPLLLTGEVHVHPDLWLPNEKDYFDQYIKKEKRIFAKLSYKGAPQGFFIPSFVAKKYQIKSIEDLKGKEHIFDLNADGVGDIWVGAHYWNTSIINRSKMKEYGLQLSSYESGQVEFLQRLKKAMNEETPILFYYWGPEWPLTTYDLYQIQEPEYDPKKWSFDTQRPEEIKISCAYPKGEVYVGVSYHLKKASPKAFQFFQNWSIPLKEVGKLIEEYEDVPGNPKKSALQVASDWIERHPKVIEKWLEGIEL